MINSLLRSLRHMIRSTLYDNDESIDIILEYNNKAVEEIYKDMEKERKQRLQKYEEQQQYASNI
jgi:hypothetical protein